MELEFELLFEFELLELFELVFELLLELLFELVFELEFELLFELVFELLFEFELLDEFDDWPRKASLMSVSDAAGTCKGTARAG